MFDAEYPRMSRDLWLCDHPHAFLLTPHEGMIMIHKLPKATIHSGVWAYIPLITIGISQRLSIFDLKHQPANLCGCETKFVWKLYSIFISSLHSRPSISLFLIIEENFQSRDLLACGSFGHKLSEMDDESGSAHRA